MKHLIGIEVDSLDELQQRIEKDFLGNLKYNNIDEQFEGRQGQLFIKFNVCHVEEDTENNIEESFYIDSITEEIRD